MNIFKSLTSVLLVSLLLILTGCTSPRVLVEGPSAGDVMGAMGYPGAGQSSQTSTATGSQGSGAPPANSRMWSRYMISHARIVFRYSFAPGGMWISRASYRPGEWTRFKMKGVENNESITIEKALLKVTEEDNEWWRVSWSTDDKTWIYEGLIDPTSNNLLRLRGKDPKGNIQEIPVTKGTRVYRSPRELTEESIEGAIVGSEVITVDGKSIQTEHVRYGAGIRGGALEWWLNDEIPGGVVKYQSSSESGNATWTSNLAGYGTDATTTLNSY